MNLDSLLDNLTNPVLLFFYAWNHRSTTKKQFGNTGKLV